MRATCLAHLIRLDLDLPIISGNEVPHCATSSILVWESYSLKIKALADHSQSFLVESVADQCASRVIDHEFTTEQLQDSAIKCDNNN
jgi:hypothetical protein